MGIIEFFFWVLGFMMVLVILSGIGYGIIYAFDAWFLPTQSAQGEIIWKQHSPQSVSYATAFAMSASNPVAPVPLMNNPVWEVGVRVGNRTGSLRCGESFYSRTSDGFPITVHFGNGRLSGDLYVKGLS